MRRSAELLTRATEIDITIAMVVLSRSAAKRQGSVVCAEKTYASLEEIANQQDVKGVYFERGPHTRVADMENWLEQRADGVICSQTILVATPVSGPLDECGCGDDACYEDSRSRQGALPKLGGGAEIRAACVRLVKDLPATFRESVSHDAQALADMCVRLCPTAPWLTLTLEVQHYNACTKWHQDSVVSRGIICYAGPGTCTADDKSVRWEKIERSNEACVPHAEIKQISTNAVLLMKGNLWPSIQGFGLTHKSPNVSENPPKRLLLKVDLEKGLRNPSLLF